MKHPIRTLFLSAALAWLFTLSFAALAQENPTPPPAPAASDLKEAAPAAADAAETPKTPESAKPAEPPAEAAAPAAQAEEAKPELRRLDTDSSTDEKPAPKKKLKSKRPVRVRPIDRTGDERVSIGHSSRLDKDEKADAVVSVFGNSTSDGEVYDAVVSVLGSSTSTGKTGGAVVSVIGNSRASGTVGDAVVSVLGNTYVNGKVAGEAVAVLGNVELGPEAEIGGDVVAVGGTVKKDPKSVVRGHVNSVALGGRFSDLRWLHAWFENCVLYARPLAIGENLGWVWIVAGCFLLFYALLALLFPGGVDKCVATLEERPGRTVLASLLALLLSPVVVVLLCITVIGIVLVPFIAAGLFFAGIFGKVVILAWLGRRVLRLIGPGATSHAAVAVLFGGLIVMGLYLVPVLGFIVYKVIGVLGLGVVVYTLVLGSRSDKPAAPTPPVRPVSAAPFAGGAIPVVATPVTPGAEGDAAASAAAATPQPAASAAPFGAPPPVMVSAVTLPRAGFWIRVAAAALDFLIVAMAANMLPSFLRPNLPVLLAAYCIVFWTLKSTTVGGIVCNLRVVRLDDRPIDWATALVRSLASFLSFVVAGLGFIWVAFDDEKQSWHDKIAGTTIVVVPKGTPLV